MRFCGGPRKIRMRAVLMKALKRCAMPRRMIPRGARYVSVSAAHDANPVVRVVRVTCWCALALKSSCREPADSRRSPRLRSRKKTPPTDPSVSRGSRALEGFATTATPTDTCGCARGSAGRWSPRNGSSESRSGRDSKKARQVDEENNHPLDVDSFLQGCAELRVALIAPRFRGSDIGIAAHVRSRMLRSAANAAPS